MLTKMKVRDAESVSPQITARSIFNRVGLTFLFALLAYQVGVSLLDTFFERFVPFFSASPWYNWLLQFFGMYALAAPLCYLMLRRLPAAPAPSRARLGGKRFLFFLLIALGALYSTNMLSQILIVLVSRVKGGPIVNPVEYLIGADMLLPGILFGGILGPIVEEYLFRYLLIRPLRSYGEGLCLFASGLIFALFHANLYQVFYAFVLGALFAFIRLRTGTILYCSLYHILINLTGLFLIPALTQLPGGQGEWIASAFILASIFGGFLLLVLHIREISLLPVRFPFQPAFSSAFFLSPPVSRDIF
jgi:membrane protease YdiL (CAAX protease family)